MEETILLAQRLSTQAANMRKRLQTGCKRQHGKCKASTGGQTAHPLGTERSLPLPMPGGLRRGVKADAGSRGRMAVRMGRGGLSSTVG